MNETPEDTPYLTVLASIGSSRLVTVRIHNSWLPYAVHWGDGTKTESDNPNRLAIHLYEYTGTYTVTALDKSFPDRFIARARIWVREDLKPQYALNEVEPGVYEVVSQADPAEWVSAYRVDWGDDTVDEKRTPTGAVVARHVYASPGQYQLRVTDLDTTRYDKPTLVVPAADPDLTVTTAGMTATLTTAATAPATVTWGDATVAEPVAGGQAHHTYQAAGVYVVQLARADTGAVTASTVTIPGGSNAR